MTIAFLFKLILSSFLLRGLSGLHPKPSPGVDSPLPRCSFMQNDNRCYGTSASEVTLRPLRCQRNVSWRRQVTRSASVRFQLVAPRLEGAANLSVDTGLRQR